MNTYLEDTGTSITHRFYVHASLLFNQLAAHAGIGIRTPRIEDEANDKLQKAFEDTVEEQTGRRHWRSSSYGLNRCMDAMYEFMSMLSLMEVKEDDEWKHHRKSISQMYSGIIAEMSEMRWTQEALVQGASANLRDVASEVYNRQIRHHRNVAPKLLWHENDEKILADVLWLFGRLRKTGVEVRMIFTSCDTGFVSSRGNRVIPFKILATFGIECDWPAVAATKISSHLTSFGF